MTLFELWHNETNKDSKILAIFDHVANILMEEDFDSSLEEKLKEKIRIFCSSAHRIFNNFKSKHSNWLLVETVFDHLDTDADIILPPKSSTSGRSRLSYEEKSLQSKRAEEAHLSKETQQHGPKLIVHAASISARQKSDNYLAAVLKEVNRSRSRPSKIRKMLFASKKEPIAYTAEEVLEFIFENSLSKQQYLNMRHGVKFRNCKSYPSYEEILQCKYKCRVQELSVSDTIAKVPLQILLDHTTKRIVSLQQEVILCAIESANDNKFICEIIFSYGFDESSGQAAHKQKFDSPGVKSDYSLFATTVIPLSLVANNNLIL